MRLGFPDSISDQSRTAGRGQTAVQRYPLQKMENLEQKQPRIIGGTSVRPSSSEVTMKFDDAMPEQMMEGVNTKTTADSVLQRAALMVCESRCPANQNQVFSSSVPSSNSPQNIAVPNKTATGYTQGEHFPQVDQRKRFNHQCSTENSECVGNYHRLCAMRSILSSNAPLIVEVWLFADCCCNFTSEQLNWENLCCDAVLIEVWTFQKIVKRCGESVSGTLDANALFQAIRSHLSFSQLASWLVSSRGQSPSSIHYRLCPGGDVLSPSSKVTQRSFHFHSFPSCVPQPKSEFLLSAQVGEGSLFELSI
ncbi:atos homolog protein A-like [Convolutriloba macropyga]|uniref:atos homolog protein A-like n=1 Tax=Convolutriloba macropyga TaxID=536237 RepID=UPI003F524F27